MTYFPFSDFWWFYLGFTGLVLVLLALDLGVFHRHAHVVSIREASAWSVVWVALSLAFNFAFYQYARALFRQDPRFLNSEAADGAARGLGLEFLTGYLIEKALSLDNIFIFAVIFGFLGIPALHQHRVLFFGIIGALVFRAIFIALGSALLQFHWVAYLFGGLLIVTAIKMLVVPEHEVEPERNPVVRLFRRFVPVTAELHGQRFFVRSQGALRATPLLLALLLIEISDILFAIDSVPAIFAITREPLIVFTSNLFAILGLRSLYFMLAAAVVRFAFLKYGLAFVLAFVGLKMVWLNDAYGGEFPILWSLAIIAGMISLSIAASLLSTRQVRS